MARHREAGYIPTAQEKASPNSPCGRSDKVVMSEEDLVSDVDEPPDERNHFPRLRIPNQQIVKSQDKHFTSSPCQASGKASLLTQAFLTPHDLTPISDAEAPLLTSDGGLTSPTRTNTPSPPLPTSSAARLAILPSTDLSKSNLSPGMGPTHISRHIGVSEKPSDNPMEAGLGRRRCITFACGKQPPVSKSTHEKLAHNLEEVTKSTDPQKRRRMLTFVCPTKPSEALLNEDKKQPPKPLGGDCRIIPPYEPMSIPQTNSQDHHEYRSTINHSSSNSVTIRGEADILKRPSVFNRQNLELSEATRFHEFAGSFDIEDEWIREPTVHRQRITVNDTLRKENAIRRIAEEAEEEALDEDVEHANESFDKADGFDDSFSDGGNETDDEEGFADSDDDSDHGSQYQFWTPGLTTAATSTDHIEHIRPMTRRTASESSIESIINTREKISSPEDLKWRTRKDKHSSKPLRMRPCTPDLPDSTDFVCGTLDEDRPLEAAYMSCLEERRRSRHKFIPQDIDPSFPTSDLDEEDDGDEDDIAVAGASDEPVWVTGKPDNSDEDQQNIRTKNIARRAGKSPMPSPKRLRSPPPKRRTVHRSPPPRCLFNQMLIHPFCPSIAHEKPNSPPSTRRPSVNISPHSKNQSLIMPRLAQRPHLTHTTSLPRTPNPFWRQHCEARFNVPNGDLSGANSKATQRQHRDPHSRGPINIVRGLENKKQWRKEKLWRQQNRCGVKEKERRCQPGKGAERMKELGLEMAGRAKGYGPKVTLVLSI